MNICLLLFNDSNKAIYHIFLTFLANVRNDTQAAKTMKITS